MIPNTTNARDDQRGNPTLAPFAKAAKFSWFVPTAPNWANVENAQRAPEHAHRRSSPTSEDVKAVAQQPSEQITEILNASS